MSLERFRCALALAASMLGPGLPAAARAEVSQVVEATRLGVGANVLYERPEKTPSPDPGPRVRITGEAQVPLHPNLSGVVAGAIDHQNLGETKWGEVGETALSADAGLRVSVPFGRVTPYLQTTVGLAYAILVFDDMFEQEPNVNDDALTFSPHARAALGVEFAASESSTTRYSVFLGLDVSYYSYDRDIDLGYDIEGDFDLFGPRNESISVHWSETRLSPSLGFEVAFAP